MGKPTYMGLSGKGLKAAITVCVMFGYILIGYDQGVMSALLTSDIFLWEFPLLNNNSTLQGFITAIYDLGCFIGALNIFINGERLGRRWSLIIGSIGVCIGVIIQVTAFRKPEPSINSALGQFTFGRVLTGIANGMIITTVAPYQSECTSSKNRGLLSCIGSGAIPYGTFLSYWLNYGLEDYTTSLIWRFPIAFQAIFALLLLSFIAFLPESPRWLLSKGRLTEGTRVCAALNNEDIDGPNGTIDKRVILDSIKVEESIGANFRYRDLFTGGKTQNFRRMLIGVSSQFFQQIGGCNAVIYYCPILLHNSVGMTQHMSLLIGGVNMAVYALFGSTTSFFIESLGRRKLFLIGTSGQLISMIITFGCLIPGTPEPAKGAVFGLFTYIASFASSYLTVPWLYAAEINPLRTRSKGVALANVVNWLTNFLVVMVTPIMVAHIGWGTYLFFGAVNACFLPFIYFFYPETKGRNLEEIDFIFAKGYEEKISYVKAAKELPYLSVEDIERLSS